MMTRIGGSWVHEYACLAKDEKLTNITKPELKIPNGSSCIEMDTAKVYLYDRENERWLPMTV